MKQYCKIVGWQRNFRSTHWNSLAPFQLERFECCERPWTSWKDPEVQEGNVETNGLRPVREQTNIAKYVPIRPKGVSTGLPTK